MPIEVSDSYSTQSWLSVSEGYQHVCGTRDDHSLWCWGYNAHGELGVGNTTSPLLVPTEVSDGYGTQSWLSVSAGRFFTCGIRSDATLWCWGADFNGNLGDAGGASQDAPQAIGDAYPTQSWTSVSAGWSYACGIRTDGSLWCWGDNRWAQLGDNTTSNRSVPTPVSDRYEPQAWTDVSTSDERTCGVRTDQSLWCWGDGTHGELGDGGEAVRYLPTSVANTP